MKKLFTTIAILMLALAASAQNYSVWNHHGIYQVNQSYDIIEIVVNNFFIAVNF